VVKLFENEFRMPKSRCPYCDKRLDAATGPGVGRPRPNDWTICLGCAQLLRFNYDLTVRKPLADETASCFALYPELKQQMEFMAAGVREMDRRPRPNWRKQKRNHRKAKAK
jgi:hypothetical protein